MVEPEIETMVIVWSSASMMTSLSSTLRSIPVRLLVLFEGLFEGPLCGFGFCCGYLRPGYPPGYPPPGYPTPGMMIWPRPEAQVIRRTTVNIANPRAIDPLDEAYSERVTEVNHLARTGAVCPGTGGMADAVTIGRTPCSANGLLPICLFRSQPAR